MENGKSDMVASRIAKADLDPDKEHDMTNLVSRLRNLLNNERLQKTVDAGKDAFDSIEPFVDHPGVLSFCRMAFGAAKAIVDHTEVWGDSYFDGPEWTTPYSRDFNTLILNVVKEFSHTTIRTSSEQDVIKIVDIGGVQMGWSMNTQYNTVGEVYVETARLARARMIIKELLWKKYNCNALLMRQVKPSLGSREPDQAGNVMFEHDTLIDPLPSAAADRYITYLQRCVSAGVRRSIMLYGPPGTGKSTMARAILHGMNFTSFRVRIGDLNNLEISTFFEAIEIFEPDAIILDDFDRSHNQEELLEVLEYFRKNVKLVIATANSRQNIDEALMRPGRFDELEPVTRMDDDVIKKILGEHVDVFEQVKDWPIVFIEEYKIRRQFMTSDEAINALQELAKRVQRLSVYNDDDSDGIVKLLRATNGRPKAINVGGHVITMEELEDEIEEDGDSIPPPFQETTPRDGPSDCHGPKDTNTYSNHVTYLEPPQSLPVTENAAECSESTSPGRDATRTNDPRKHRMKNLDTP